MQIFSRTKSLYDETSFYPAFTRDLRLATREIYIESPFITSNRVASLLPIFVKMCSRNIRVTINTRPPEEHDDQYRAIAQDSVAALQGMSVQVLYTGGLHRKLAVVDRKILWEGSLNILSQHDSCELMRRTGSEELCKEVLSFIKMKRYLN